MKIKVRQYRTKPCIIEAIQFTRDSFEEVKTFGQGSVKDLIIEDCPGGKAYCKIQTLEGMMIATEEDYIIRGLRGEYYPCKPDVFEKKYEVIE